MGLLDLWRRYTSMPEEDKGYYRRKFLDAKLHGRTAFAQYGEDVNVMEMLRTLGRKQITYVDIGANDPVLHSNTYLFYRDGSSGLLVDANPEICKRIRAKRPRDVVENVGVAAKSGPPLTLNVMDLDGLSSLSSEWSDRLEAEGLAKKVKSFEVKVVGINEILEKFGRTEIDFASLDVEGLDFDVISAWDFDRFRPFIFCIETGIVSAGKLVRDSRFHELMKARGYSPLFETYSNTIFIDDQAEDLSAT